MDRRPDHELEPRRGQSPRARSEDDFFGLEAESMSPKAQLTTSLVVIVPVVLAGVLLFAFTNVVVDLVYLFLGGLPRLRAPGEGYHGSLRELDGASCGAEQQGA